MRKQSLLCPCCNQKLIVILDCPDEISKQIKNIDITSKIETMSQKDMVFQLAKTQNIFLG